MSLLQSHVTTKAGTTVKTFLNNELAQLLLAVLLMAIYMIEIIEKFSQDQFIAGALVTVIGYYFGGKNSTTAAISATTNSVNAANNTNNVPPIP